MLTYRFTVNSDASFLPDSGIAAWAYWYRSDHYHDKRAGLITIPARHSGVAELRAVEAALLAIWQLIENEEFLQYHGREGRISIIYNTDCAFVIDAMNDKVKSSHDQNIISDIKMLTEGLDIEFRHVKAHTKFKDPRHKEQNSYINRWCDREARKVVKERVRQLNGQQKV